MQNIALIGRGGFGNVYRVQDTSGIMLARKCFSINQGPGFPLELTENIKKRFIREALVQAAIDHYNIMPIVKTELSETPPSFLMPMASSSLEDDICKDRSLGGSPLSAIMDILSGLEELHSHGITHRDLKPNNVLKLNSAQGYRYVISDFGLMSIKDTQISMLTHTGMKKGSDYYTAPEIVADLRFASPMSDIYSVGCILHDLYGTVDRIPCNEINDKGIFSDILSICTRKDPSRRFKSVADLRDAILSLGTAHAVASTPKINDMIAALRSTHALDADYWGSIVDAVLRDPNSPDSIMLLKQLSLNRISELIACAPNHAGHLGAIYSRWVQKATFAFEECDGIANRLELFLQLADLTCQSEALLALLRMGTSHNRWYVERKFVANCTSTMPNDLAKRVALEMRVLGKSTCSAIAHLEISIGFNRQNLHPNIVQALQQICQ